MMINHRAGDINLLWRYFSGVYHVCNTVKDKQLWLKTRQHQEQPQTHCAWHPRNSKYDNRDGKKKSDEQMLDPQTGQTALSVSLPTTKLAGEPTGLTEPKPDFNVLFFYWTFTCIGRSFSAHILFLYQSKFLKKMIIEPSNVPGFVCERGCAVLPDLWTLEGWKWGEYVNLDKQLKVWFKLQYDIL